MSWEYTATYSVACAAASFTATYISGLLHPLDVIKTRFQSHDGKTQGNMVPKYKGTFKAFGQIYNKEGFKGLFKGYHFSMLTQASATAIFFLMFFLHLIRYEYQKKKYQNYESKILKSVSKASFQASILCTLITQPIWVIKTRMMLSVDSLSEWRNFLMKTYEIYEQHGLRGFYKGLGINLILSLTAILQMYSYEAAKIIYDNMELPHYSLLQKSFICGGISKIASTFVSYPLTTVRTRIQQNQYFIDKKKQKYKNVMEVVVKTMGQQGVRGFYKGVWANILRGIPHRGLYFSSYQFIKVLFLGNHH